MAKGSGRPWTIRLSSLGYHGHDGSRIAYPCTSLAGSWHFPVWLVRRAGYPMLDRLRSGLPIAQTLLIMPLTTQLDGPAMGYRGNPPLTSNMRRLSRLDSGILTRSANANSHRIGSLVWLSGGLGAHKLRKDG